MITGGWFETEVSANTFIPSTTFSINGTVSASEPWNSQWVFLNAGDRVELRSTLYSPSTANFTIKLVREDGFWLSLYASSGIFENTRLVNHGQSGRYRLEIRSTSTSRIPFVGRFTNNLRLCSRLARIRYDFAYATNSPIVISNLTSMFRDMTNVFETKHGIRFTLQNNGVQQSTSLNGQCPNTGNLGMCNDICNTRCNVSLGMTLGGIVKTVHD
jgi:hypothetical protein